MLGEQLSNEHVSVVSGLARGIDVEAHVGSVRSEGGAPPIAVVAGGPDVVYPPEHSNMWRNVAERGVVLSESPPGSTPEPYKFPLRNRILAALSEVLVVVESRSTGGSMTTVREAMKRDITVMAVPGSPHVKPSEGTNDLLRDGCAPVTCVDDVLVMLGLDTRRVGGSHNGRLPPSARGLRILDLMENRPRTLDEIALLSGMPIVDVAVVLGTLEAMGWVAHSDGWWEALTR
jgi:DNA processing protein